MDRNLQIKFSQTFANMSFIPLWGIVAGILGISYGKKAGYQKSIKIGSYGLAFNTVLAIGAAYLASNNQDFASHLYSAIFGSLIFLFLSISIGLIIGIVIRRKFKSQ